MDFSQFSDYEEVKSRFHENATVNYEYDGGCYGIPVNQMWPMMFYRKDVLSELGINSPPETWQELIDMLPALQRNYMGVGLASSSRQYFPGNRAWTYVCDAHASERRELL